MQPVGAGDHDTERQHRACDGGDAYDLRHFDGLPRLRLPVFALAD
jgi:hypothetical protein